MSMFKLYIKPENKNKVEFKILNLKMKIKRNRKKKRIKKKKELAFGPKVLCRPIHPSSAWPRRPAAHGSRA
jgi:hypothetical protein